jgi:hypothetical protein
MTYVHGILGHYIGWKLHKDRKTNPGHPAKWPTAKTGSNGRQHEMDSITDDIEGKNLSAW